MPASPIKPPSFQPKTPNYGQPQSPFGRGGGSDTVRSAAQGARYALDTMGIPTLSTLFGPNGQFKQFGFDTPDLMKPGAAPVRNTASQAGIDDAKKNLGFAKSQLGARAAEANRFRREYNDPTHTGAFRDEMAIANSRISRANEAGAEQARVSTARRGFSGGFNPERDVRAGMKALSDSVFEGAKSAREGALAGYGTAMGGYGSAAGLYGQAFGDYEGAQNSVRQTQAGLDEAYGRDVAAHESNIQDYNRNLIGRAGLGAEYIKSLGSAFGSFNPGSFFGTALEGTQFDVNRYDQSRLRAQQRADAARFGHGEGGSRSVFG